MNISKVFNTIVKNKDLISKETEVIHTEPIFPDDLTIEDIYTIKRLYDGYLIYFNNLTNKQIEIIYYLNSSKLTLETIEAGLHEEAQENELLKNSESRKNWVLCNDDYLSAKQEYLYFKSIDDILDLKLKSTSKFIDRLFRELNSRAYRTPSDAIKEKVISARDVIGKYKKHA